MVISFEAERMPRVRRATSGAAQPKLTSFFPTAKTSAPPPGKRLKMDAPPMAMPKTEKADVKPVEAGTASPAETLTLASPPLRRKVSAVPEAALTPAAGTREPGRSTAKRRLQFARRLEEKTKDPARQKLVVDGEAETPSVVDLLTASAAKKPVAPLVETVNLSPMKALPPLPPSAVLKRKLKGVRNTKVLLTELAKSNEVFRRLNESRTAPVEEATPSQPAALATVVRTLASPLKSPAKRREESAHARLGLLSRAELEGLGLPAAHRLLLAFFHHGDRFAFHLAGRQEAVSFDKLQANLQRVTKRAFERRHLGQIKTVYPEAYTYRLERTQSRFGQRGRPAQSQLVIAPNTKDDLLRYSGVEGLGGTPVKAIPADYALVTQPQSPVKPGEASPCKRPKGEQEETEIFDPTRLLYRQSIFKSNLVRILKDQHRAFLASLSPPVELSALEEARLCRWHPAFLSAATEVAVAELPQEVVSTEGALSAASFLEKATSIAVLPARLKRAAEEVAAKRALNFGPSPTKPQVAARLVGLPSSLVAEIKAKEAAAAKKRLIVDQATLDHVARIQRLQAYAKPIRSIVVLSKPGAARSASIEQGLLVRKLGDAIGFIKKSEAESDLVELSRVVPSWVSRVALPGKGVYFRFSLTLPMPTVLDKLAQELV